MPRRRGYKVTSVSDRGAILLVLLLLVVFLFIFHMEIVVYIALAAWFLETIWLVIRSHQKDNPLTKQEAQKIDMCLVVFSIGIALAWMTNTQVIFGLICGILVILFFLWKVRKFQKRKIMTDEIAKSLRGALETMDSTSRWYNNEEEANRELVSCLKASQIDAVYHHRLSNGRTADAKIGETLIEGKLSPNTSEVDRLIGQLNAYTQYGNKLNVVIYGKFDLEGRKRLENEIEQRYAGRVFLTYLNNPKRQRVQF